MGPLERLPAWPEILAARLAEAWRTPFVYGQHDCMLFPLRTIDAMCGSTIADPFIGTYDNATGALRTIIEYGGAELDEAVERIAAEWKLPECRPLALQRGDLAIIDAAHTGIGIPIGALCVGRDLAAMTGAGLVHLPRGMARRGWRI